jgi:hypothetical protein
MTYEQSSQLSVFTRILSLLHINREGVTTEEIYATYGSDVHSLHLGTGTMGTNLDRSTRYGLGNFIEDSVKRGHLSQKGDRYKLTRDGAAEVVCLLALEFAAPESSPVQNTGASSH